jgi:hypothetical protein
MNDEHKSIDHRNSGSGEPTQKKGHKPSQNNSPKSGRVELPVAPQNDLSPGLVYIAYGENGDDVAFEMSDNIEEALGIYQIMKEDGFASRLYQAMELDIVEED